jgi:hypothetical protein
MKLNLNSSPKTLGQNVLYYSLCMLLATSCWFHTGRFGVAMTTVAAMIVGFMLRGRVRCQA